MTRARGIVTELHGRPYPVQWRYQGALDAWTKALGGTETWRQWSAPGTTYCAIKRELMCQFECNSLSRGSGESFASVSETHSLFAVPISVNLKYYLHGGTVIAATPALESLLTHSDIDLSLPMSMVAPPYAAQYVYFGEQASRHLKAPNATLPGHMFDGAYCFLTREVRHDASIRWMLELVFVTKRNGRHNGQITLVGETDRGSASVGEWLGEVLGAAEAALVDECREAMHAAVSYVVKLFLYMGLRQARLVEHDDYADALRRATGLGERKRTMLLKRSMSLYNAIVVGPDTLPSQAAFDVTGISVAPHWRRGHFRMQAHGLGRQERKLIFVAPMLIHADRLQGEQPMPKEYCAHA